APGLAVIECALRHVDGGWLLVSLTTSKNIFVDGRVVEGTVLLRADQTFRIGENELRVQKLSPSDHLTADESRHAPIAAQWRSAEKPGYIHLVKRIDNSFRREISNIPRPIQEPGVRPSVDPDATIAASFDSSWRAPARFVNVNDDRKIPRRTLTDT